VNNDITVIYETPDILICDKPAGVPFHTSGAHTGLVKLLRAQCSTHALYPVHRLDKGTSGLILFAKNKSAQKELLYQFRCKKIKKYYLAIGEGKPKKKQGLIKGDMERTRRGSWKLTPGKRNPAVTRFLSESVSPGKRFFLIRLFTGKTHQVRVALQSISSPILGDVRYNAATAAAYDRMYLHAYALQFYAGNKLLSFRVLPSNGTLFTDPLFMRIAEKYGEPWNDFLPINKAS